MATNATISDINKETRGPSTADSNRTCSDRRSGKNKCGNGTSKQADRVGTI